VKWAEIDSAVIDWEGRPAAMVFLSDITFRKSAEEAAVHSARLRAIADLSQGVAHHFNNLLQIVTASASLSISDLESGDSTEVKATLERMLSAASRGAEMVRRLHIFANARTDYHAGDEITFDVSDTARNAAEILSPLWKTQPEETGPKIDLQLDLKEGCLTLGRENEVFEVLVNLIRNAAEALPAGGAIHVETRREAEEVVINVRDTGPGISEEDLTRVFQPFWSTKGLGIGKGMGLAVTHGLVKGHGGVISVQSKPGKGAAFTVRLPKAPDSALR
jgi:signal transduction histidine kinase